MNQRHIQLDTILFYNSLQTMSLIYSHLKDNYTYKQKGILEFWDLYFEIELLAFDVDRWIFLVELD